MRFTLHQESDAADQGYLNTLIELLNERFDKEGVNSLCFRLGIDSDDLPDAKNEKIIAFVKRLAREQRFPDLIEHGKKIRTDIDWPDSPGIKTEMAAKARLSEHKREYQKAVAQWEKIQAMDPQDPQTQREIQCLNDKIAQNARLMNCKTQLMRRMAVISPVFKELGTRLKHIEKEGIDEEAEMILDVIEAFLSDALPAADFIQFCRDSLNEKAGQGAEGLDYTALSKRLRRGNIALFLGLDVARQFGHPLPSSDKLAPKLADRTDYDDFHGSLAEVCEYLQINHQYGRDSLLAETHNLFKSTVPTPIPLYELLADISVPLVLISAGYDTLLEKTFDQRGKKYVVLFHSKRSEKAGAEQIDIKYSDRTEVESCFVEKFSGLRVLEEKYSLIYKIRGGFESCIVKNIGDCLVLSEQDYLTLFKSIDRLIPSYLTGSLTNRGFWFLGHHPKTWEDRMLVNIIMEKRAQAQRPEPALAIHKNADRFANAHWQHNGVKNYSIDLKEFIEKLT